MAGRFDEKFIENLNNFSVALKNITELLEEQAKTHPTDVVNQLLESFDGDKVSKIAEDIEEIKNSTAEINERNQQILEEVKAIRKEKESGMFEKIENGDNKSKIVDGIKTVILIAGGVLAIGMAFKLIGNVDFLSVIALSAGIYVIAKAYEQIAKMKGLTPGEVLTISAILPMMALSTLLSAYILSKIPTMPPEKILTAIGVAAGMGVLAYFINKIVNDIEIKNIFGYVLLPVVIPLMAAGVLGASYILNMMPALSPMQLITAIGVGVALVPIAYAASLLIKSMKGVSFKDVLFTGLVIPVISLGVLVAANILTNIPTVSIKQAISAILVGIALIPTAFAFSMIVKTLKDKKVKVTDLLIATIAVPLIAAGLVISSMILQNFVPLAQPWQVILSSITIGISILAMTPALWMMSKIKPKDLLIATIGIVGVSAATINKTPAPVNTFFNAPGPEPNNLSTTHIAPAKITVLTPIAIEDITNCNGFVIGTNA